MGSDYSHIQRIVLATPEETTATQQKSAMDQSNAYLARGHKGVRRSTGHIMVPARYSNQQGYKSRHCTKDQKNVGTIAATTDSRNTQMCGMLHP